MAFYFTTSSVDRFDSASQPLSVTRTVWPLVMDLVTREEFEVVKAMAVKAREEQEAMAARLAALEAKLGQTTHQI